MPISRPSIFAPVLRVSLICVSIPTPGAAEISYSDLMRFSWSVCASSERFLSVLFLREPMVTGNSALVARKETDTSALMEPPPHTRISASKTLLFLPFSNLRQP